MRHNFSQIICDMINSLFASTAHGLEELLKKELMQLGATGCQVVQGGVHYQGDALLMYQSLIWSRLASRVLLPLTTCAVYSDIDLYLGAQAINWPSLFNSSKTFAVHFNGTSAVIRNSQYGALKVKDAITDCFTRQGMMRPEVRRDQPDIRINVWLNRDKATISLDLAGEGLHQRGYRLQAGQAPLKENLAAAIITRSGWQMNTPLIDPMCGSGTLLIEAAMMAADCAPGLYRRHWGVQGLSTFDAGLWKSIIDDARDRAKTGMQKVSPHFFGYDNDAGVLEQARLNARHAGIAELISFVQSEASDLNNPLPHGPCGTVVTNPPYGERLDSEPALIALYGQFGRIMKQQFGGWRLSIFSASEELMGYLQLRADRQFKAKNGPLDCIQKNYYLTSASSEQMVIEPVTAYGNRLRKNHKKLDKWARREGIDCYRLYDADLSEYNVAVDRYADWVVIQEYAAPKTVDAARARRRLMDVIACTQEVLGVTASRLILKTRQRQRGSSQYQKLSDKSESILVREYDAQFWVNLTDYLDTGLFPDNRAVRRRLNQLSKGKDFLNLFAYTGSASVQAGLGGARSTTTVDMSRTYLEWAARNLQLNSLTGRQHRLIQADCLNWMSETKEQFDLIFIDPPTFSNSKRMEEDFDVQRDHLRLMGVLKRLLRHNGTILFSNNRRGFKMDYDGLNALGLQADDITAKTQSPDFARQRHSRHCWQITHVSS